MQNPIKSRKCFCCGSRYRLADHHLQPRESGGLNEERNLVTLCSTCHDAVEGQQEGLSAGDIWLNILKRKASFEQESPGRKRYRLSTENAQPCPPYVSSDQQEKFAEGKRKAVEEKRRATLNAMSTQEYFEQSDTPSSHSPVGVLMPRIIEKNPGMNFEQAREEAHRLLGKAAARRAYGVPRVLSAEEREMEKARLRTAFGSSGPTSEPRRMASRAGRIRSAAMISPSMKLGGLEKPFAFHVGVNP
jgi:hypothetical protein